MPILCALLQIYVLILIVRAVCSFFPIRPGTTFASIVGVLLALTEPVLAPVRRVIPPLGMFDLSFIVVLIGLQIIAGILCAGSGFLF